MSTDPLKWWQDNEKKFPSVAKMARQFLATPASTGGVERFFKGCTQAHSDLRKNLSDVTMENMLFAAEDWKSTTSG